MTGVSNAHQIQVAVVGDRSERFVAQESISSALEHSAAALGVDVAVRWFPTRDLADRAAEQLADADAVWCAPGSPYESMAGALAGIRVARESGRSFIGTCAGFQHGVIEFARNVLGLTDAHHAEYDDAAGSPLIIDELLCSLVGEQMHVALRDPELVGWYGSDTALEQYYCRFGLEETYRLALAAAGLEVAGTDLRDDTTRILRLRDHPFFVLTLFVPQVGSTADHPHPLVTAYLAAAARC